MNKYIFVWQYEGFNEIMNIFKALSTRVGPIFEKLSNFYL